MVAPGWARGSRLLLDTADGRQPNQIVAKGGTMDPRHV